MPESQGETRVSRTVWISDDSGSLVDRIRNQRFHPEFLAEKKSKEVFGLIHPRKDFNVKLIEKLAVS